MGYEWEFFENSTYIHFALSIPLLSEGNTKMLPIEQSRTSEPLPIWMAALVASGCQATGNGVQRRIDWQCVSGRAQYTNGGADTELIQPFGVPVQGGETVVVSWLPGDTGYTVELFQAEALAA